MTNKTANKLTFSKMHGCGNDFIMLDGINHQLPANLGELAIRLCNRHFGIGADGIITLTPAEGYDFRMTLYQSDGSQAEMCGNGARCAALFAARLNIAQAGELKMLTPAGLICPTLLSADDEKTTGTVRVDMGLPHLTPEEIPCTLPGDQILDCPVEVLDRQFKFSAVSMGNPHAIIFLDTNPEDFPVTTYGPLLEKHPIFPAKTNVEFVQVQDEHNIRMRVWERGAGETLACGTGACATAVAAILTGRAQSPVNIHLDGGTLQITWQPGESVFMTGPATLSFDGEVAL